MGSTQEELLMNCNLKVHEGRDAYDRPSYYVQTKDGYYVDGPFTARQRAEDFITIALGSDINAPLPEREE